MLASVRVDLLLFIFLYKTTTILNQFFDVPSLQPASISCFPVKVCGYSILFHTRLSDFSSTFHGYLLPCVIVSMPQSPRSWFFKARKAGILTQDLWVWIRLFYKSCFQTLPNGISHFSEIQTKQIWFGPLALDNFIWK